MDFKKILATFLAVFVVIDIFLAVQWFQLHQPASNPTSSESILTEMRNDGIKVGKLGQTEKTGVYLAGKSGETFLRDRLSTLSKTWDAKLTNDQLTVTPSRTINLGKSRADVRKAIDKIVNNPRKVIAGSQYRYDAKLTKYANKTSTESDVVVYAQKISDSRSFMSQRAQIRFVLTANHELKSYTQSYVENPQVLRDSTSLISEEKALIGAYQYNEIPNNGTVNWSELGYSPLTTVHGDIIFVPAWIFSVTDPSDETTILRVNALNGSLMK